MCVWRLKVGGGSVMLVILMWKVFIVFCRVDWRVCKFFGYYLFIRIVNIKVE